MRSHLISQPFNDSFSITISKAGADDCITFVGADSIVDEGGGDWTITYTNNGTTYTLNVSADDAMVKCFEGSAKLLTSRGEKSAKDIEIGDLIYTKDQQFVPVRWIGHRVLTQFQLQQNPQFRPVLIRAGALGQGVPKRDLRVSQQHRVLVRGRVVERMFGDKEVLVPAVKLTMLSGVNVDEDIEFVEFFHFLLDDHHIVISEGVETESLFVGPEVLKGSLGPDLLELSQLFPELLENLNTGRQKEARFLVPPRRARKLVERLHRNRKPVLETVMPEPGSV